MEVRLADRSGAAWTLEEAQFQAEDGEPLTGVRMLEPTVVQALSPGRLRVVVVPSERVGPGTYKLRLKGGGRELVVENVTFK